MFPKERSTLLGMAGDALLTRKRLDLEAGAVIAMDVMALATGHLAFPHRVMGDLIELGLIGMAGGTDLGLLLAVQDRILGHVNLVAGGAG
jgi:hypothetical protein